MIKKFILALCIPYSTLLSSSCNRNSCLKYSLTTCSTPNKQENLNLWFYGLSGYQTGKLIHEKVVYNLDEKNIFDRLSREISGLIVSKYCVDVLRKQEFTPSLISSIVTNSSLECCMPLTSALFAHTIQKEVEKNIKNSFSLNSNNTMQ